MPDPCALLCEHANPSIHVLGESAKRFGASRSQDVRQNFGDDPLSHVHEGILVHAKVEGCRVVAQAPGEDRVAFKLGAALDFKLVDRSNHSTVWRRDFGNRFAGSDWRSPKSQ